MKVLAEAPCRISLFGGSTDVPPYSTQHGGICINMAINIKQRILLNDDNQWELLPQDNPDFFHAILDNMCPGNNFGVKHEFNGAIGSGISTSAALAVALVGAVNHYCGLNMTLAEIAERARQLEIEKVGLLCGRQDQYCAVHGGVNYMAFSDKTFVFPLEREFISTLLPYIQLFYLGTSRVASKILKEYDNLTMERVESMNRLKFIALESLEPIKRGNIAQVGKLLRESWEVKKKTAKGVTNDTIDAIYELGYKNGAIAGKVLGAGGGGHIMFLVPPRKQPAFKNIMSDSGIKWIDFSIDWQGLDCRIV
jgi:D-glycero-alpha-D-manno-heptose-7-phosphate kinase